MAKAKHAARLQLHVPLDEGGEESLILAWTKDPAAEVWGWVQEATRSSCSTRARQERGLMECDRAARRQAWWIMQNPSLPGTALCLSGKQARMTCECLGDEIHQAKRAPSAALLADCPSDCNFGPVRFGVFVCCAAHLKYTRFLKLMRFALKYEYDITRKTNVKQTTCKTTWDEWDVLSLATSLTSQALRFSVCSWCWATSKKVRRISPVIHSSWISLGRIVGLRSFWKSVAFGIRQAGKCEKGFQSLALADRINGLPKTF